MNADIQFGKLEKQGPRRRVRPDRDRQYAVVACGSLGEQDLPIFVDLDVMRDMEGHSRQNTRVELGGVILGGKHLDEDGQPFVVVTEALRAEHYEATRGSFKFTHDTWSQITRDRAELPEELQLVGWYHTHPDWGVFLSGMDTFICDNFFADSLDVALVIDPCRGDRGWFQWDGTADTPVTRRVDGFYLMANRFRRSELLYFASELAEVNPAFHDSRYEASFGGNDMQPVVHLHQQQSGVQMIALMSMLTIQTLVLALLVWRVLIPPVSETGAAQEYRNQVYREILGSMATGTPAGETLVSQVEQLGKNNRELQTSVEGQAALIVQLKNDRTGLQNRQTELQRDLSVAMGDLSKKDASIKTLESDLADARAGRPPSRSWLSWPLLAGVALLTAIFGLIGGRLWGSSRPFEFEESGPAAFDEDPGKSHE